MKTVIFTIIAFLIINCTFNFKNSIAQWMKVSNGLDSLGIIRSVVSKNNNIFLTNGYGIYKSTNEGISWNLTFNRVVFCLAADSNKILAGSGGDSTLFYSTNNGTNWNCCNTFICPLVFDIYTIVLDNNFLYAGGLGGIILSSNNGMSWSLSTGTESYSMFKKGTILLSGGYYNGISISTNNGINWSPTNLSNTWNHSFASNDSFFFAGSSYSANSGGLYKSNINQGLVWGNTSLSNKSVYALTTYNNYLFAGCYNYPVGLGGVYYSSNNGNSWININHNMSINTVLSLHIYNGYIYAGTAYNGVWKRSILEIIGMQNISSGVPCSYSLEQNYPNPFNSTTNIKFDVVRLSDVKIVVYDVMGREVEILINEKLNAGTYQVDWNANDYPSGVYFYRLQTVNFSDTKKMILTR